MTNENPVNIVNLVLKIYSVKKLCIFAKNL